MAFTPEVIGQEVTGEILNDRDRQEIRAGGIANNTTIYGLGQQTVWGNGIANGTTINGRGQQYVYESGIAYNTTLNIQGAQVVTEYGTAYGTIMNDDAELYIHVGGVVNGTIMNGNSFQEVIYGGFSNNTTINDNSHQSIQSDGIANGSIINNTGMLTVTTGGKLIGQTVVNDQGTFEGPDGTVQNEGELIFQRSEDYTLNFDLAGTGSLTQNGPHSLTLSTASSYSGATTINGGSIKAGADNVFSTLSDYTTHTGGTLDLDGYNQMLQSLNNGGTVSFGGTGGNTLTITGDYIGNNGLLNMNSVLEDDDSVTDKLIIGGNTSGNTFVQVNNLGGSGAQTLNGIELITVSGNSVGEFTQSGRIVAGAYDYYLARGIGSNDTNWYLQSSIPISVPGPDVPGEPSPPMIERPEASGYSANLAAANNMFVTRLHDRLGETHYIDALTGEQKVTSLWLRNEGGHNRSRDSQDQLRTQSNRYVMQLGGDIAQWSHNGADRFHLGLMAGYGNSKSTTESRLSGYSARASVDG
ncbi:autotransporter outer membrane beta-barrel domain-containing protein, partial [Yersinia alsatica]|uniref:autotransporter outer membrane beta-barrel domain-containing protein n=1 Tax=Yersinia alsatica TaxID=2890317 RepID=UPI001643A8CB